MWLYSIVTYAHFISICMLFSSLIFELSIIKEKMKRHDFLTLRKADLFFGISAGFTIASGLFRMFYFGKGEDYYMSNPIFILKFSLFIVVGLLSIYPTIQFLKLRNLQIEFVTLKNFRIIRVLLLIEIILLLIIPFLAILVAKGFKI